MARQGQHVLHKEEIRQGLKFIRTKENGHSSSAPADRQWGKDGDRRRTMPLTPANLTLLLSPPCRCATVPRLHAGSMGRQLLKMTWKSKDEKISISGDNVSARGFIAATVMEGHFHSICSITLLNSNCGGQKDSRYIGINARGWTLSY